MQPMNFEGVSPELALQNRKRLKILDRGALNINFYSYKPLNAGWVEKSLTAVIVGLMKGPHIFCELIFVYLQRTQQISSNLNLL
jgi:hypothetical protein